MAIRERRRIGAKRVFLSLSNRPAVMIGCSFLKIRHRTFPGVRGYGALCGCSPRWGYDVAVPNDNFMDNPLHSVTLWSELALFDGALDENVVALIESHGNAGKIAVKREVVPVGVLLRFAIGVLISVTLAESHIGNGRSRGKVADGWFGGQIAADFEAVSLHMFNLLFESEALPRNLPPPRAAHRLIQPPRRRQSRVC